jgi:hypothetical protein
MKSRPSDEDLEAFRACKKGIHSRCRNKRDRDIADQALRENWPEEYRREE